MKFIGIIPARYASTRFPGKPLALLGGVSVIERVYRRVQESLDRVVVATDDERIRQAVEQFGGQAVMTSPAHRSGTDRCHEAYLKAGAGEDVVVNIQGDEPFIRADQIAAVCSCFGDAATEIATLIKPFAPEDGFAALANPNSPKVVVNSRMEALYFSRSVIPHLRGRGQDDWLREHTYYKHIGLYAYRADALERITALPPSALERAESLEQLRWLENGLRIRCAITHAETVGIDTPADLERAERFLAAQKA